MSEKGRNIIIVCEDTYGLDVFTIIEAINSSAVNKKSESYNVVGFLNENPDTWMGLVQPAPLLGGPSDWACKVDAAYVIAIRDPGHKRIAVESLKARGAQFETIMAPWVQYPAEFVHGEGCVIANYMFKHKSKFGDFVITDSCICESADIGDFSTVEPFVNITTATIGKGVHIGTHAAIIPGRAIGDFATIYPGSIVMNNIKVGTCVAGVPASRNLKKWEEL